MILKVKDLITLIQSEATTFFNVTLTDSNTDPATTTTVINKDYLSDVLVLRFWDWGMFKPDTFNITDYDWFKKAWSSFVRENQDNWNNIFTALKAEYNKIHNFDRHEEVDESTDGGKVTTTIFNSSSITNGERNTETSGITKNGVTVYDEVEVNTYDGTPRTVQRNKPNTHVKGYASTDSTNSNGTNTVEAIRPQERTANNHLYGNIGITSSQDMIQQEIDLRIKIDIEDMILDGFVHKYMFIAGED